MVRCHEADQRATSAVTRGCIADPSGPGQPLGRRSTSARPSARGNPSGEGAGCHCVGQPTTLQDLGTLSRRGPAPGSGGGLLRVDAVGIDRSYWIASHLFNLVLRRACLERHIVDPSRRIELPPDESKRIEETRPERSTDMVCTLHQPVFVADTSIEQHTMDKLRALIEIE